MYLVRDTISSDYTIISDRFANHAVHHNAGSSLLAVQSAGRAVELFRSIKVD